MNPIPQYRLKDHGYQEKQMTTSQVLEFSFAFSGLEVTARIYLDSLRLCIFENEAISSENQKLWLRRRNG